MFKTGISTLEDLKDKNRHFTWLGKQKNISITLYDQIQNEDNVDELAEQILLLSADDRGAYKRTYSKRFEKFDEHIIEHLKNYFTDDNLELSIHDVAVSDGRTAGDFFKKLIPYFPHVNYEASDYNPYLYSIKKGRLTVILSDTYKPIEILYPPFVFNISKRDSYKYYPLNHVVRLYLMYFRMPSMIKKFQKNKAIAKKILMFDSSVVQLTRQDQRFRLDKHSVLDSFDEQVHIIRAMNILNVSYFNDEDFKKILNNIHHGLNNNGLFITGSNQNAGSTVHGGIYQKTAESFSLLWQSGEGSPIKDIISAFKMH